MSDRFTQKAENALNRSVKIAEILGHTYIGTEHLLLALAEDEPSCADGGGLAVDARHQVGDLLGRVGGAGEGGGVAEKEVSALLVVHGRCQGGRALHGRNHRGDGEVSLRIRPGCGVGQKYMEQAAFVGREMEGVSQVGYGREAVGKDFEGEVAVQGDRYGGGRMAHGGVHFV